MQFILCDLCVLLWQFIFGCGSAALCSLEAEYVFPCSRGLRGYFAVDSVFFIDTDFEVPYFMRSSFEFAFFRRGFRRGRVVPFPNKPDPKPDGDGQM